MPNWTLRNPNRFSFTYAEAVDAIYCCRAERVVLAMGDPKHCRRVANDFRYWKFCVENWGYSCGGSVEIKRYHFRTKVERGPSGRFVLWLALRPRIGPLLVAAGVLPSMIAPDP